MAIASPRLTGSETSDALNIATQAVAPVAPQTAAPLSGLNTTTGNLDKFKAKQNKESTEETGIQMPLEAHKRNTTTEINTQQDVTSPVAASDSVVEMIDHIEDVRPPPKAKEDISMLDKYAFDLEGKAYDHNVPQHLTNATFLYVGRLHPRTTTLMGHRAEAKDEMDTCPPLIPDENELNSETKTWDGRKAIECVWVGMLPGWKTRAKTAESGSQPQRVCSVSSVDEAQVDGPAGKKMGAAKKAKQALRITDLTPSNILSLPYDPTALRVVAKRSTKVTKSWWFFALLNPEPATKLCQGWRVASDEVFFFKAFRGDEATSYQQRRQITQEKIRALIFYKEPRDSPDLPQPTQPGSAPSTPSTGKVSQKSSGLPSPPPTGRPSKQPLKKPSKKITSMMAGSSADADHEFEAMLDYMVRITTEAECNVNKENTANAKTAGSQKRNVFFEGDDGKFSDTLGNTINSPIDITFAEEDLDAEAKSLAIRHDVDSVTTKMMNLVMKLSNNKDLAALNQGYIMLKCIGQRRTLPTTSALSLYLNVPPGEDGDPAGCAVKLRELLNLFPQLEDVDMDNHVLAWVVRGLQLTGQSIDIELLPLYLGAFSALFRAKFGDTANHQARLVVDDLVDMTCQARDDAERILEKETSQCKQPGALRCPSHPYVEDVAKIWKAFDWTDPRQNAAAPEEKGEAESAELGTTDA